jgi:hypothetical protein
MKKLDKKQKLDYFFLEVLEEQEKIKEDKHAKVKILKRKINNYESRRNT